MDDKLSAAEQAVCDRLERLYGSPARGHHNWDHVEYMLDVIGRNAALVNDMRMVRMAVWFHDAVFDTREKDNEEKSALLASEWLQGVCSAAEISDVGRTIMATKHHRVPFILGRESLMRDIALVIDADLAILGDTPERFDVYDAGTRFEYGWVSDADWAAGRGQFMRDMLARPHIFITREMQEEREEQARTNIARLLGSLGG